MEKAFQNQEEVEGIITNRVKGGWPNIDLVFVLPDHKLTPNLLESFDHQ